MQKLATTIGGALLAVAYGILFISLMARMIDHGGWWIPAGVAALLIHVRVMRYLGETNVIEVDGGFPADITADGDNSQD